LGQKGRRSCAVANESESIVIARVVPLVDAFPVHGVEPLEYTGRYVGVPGDRSPQPLDVQFGEPVHQLAGNLLANFGPQFASVQQLGEEVCRHVAIREEVVEG